MHYNTKSCVQSYRHFWVMAFYRNMGTDHRGKGFEVVLEFGSTKRCQKGVSMDI